jgi:3-oxoacyl-[acyl-carrier-protein] synthase-3
MEIAACRDALADAGVSPAQVDLYYGFSHVPDYIEPTNHGRVHHALGLPLHSAAMTVAAGCASLLPMLATASRMVQAGEHERALISLSSATSRITNYGFPSSVNIGDGAVAAVIGAVEQGFGYVGQAQRTRGDLFEGVVIAPTGAEDVPWYRGDVHQSKLMITNIDRGATHVMGAHAVSLCREVVTDLYEKFGVGPEDIDFALFPQSTAWFGSALGEAVGIPEHKRLGYEDHFARFGHLIAVSLPLNLYLAYRSGRLRKGDLVLLYTPGVGFTQAAALYRWNL